MIKSNEELKTTMERIARFQQQVIAVRAAATSPEENYRASAGGYLAEIDRMLLEVRDDLWAPPANLSGELATV